MDWDQIGHSSNHRIFLNSECNFVVFPAEIIEKEQSLGGEQAAEESLPDVEGLCCPQCALYAQSGGKVRMYKQLNHTQSRVCRWVILLGSSNV